MVPAVAMQTATLQWQARSIASRAETSVCMGRHPMATSISRSRRVQICRTGVDPTRRSNRLQQAVKGSIASHHVRAPVQQSLAKLRSCPSFRCACMTLRTITHSTVGPGPCIAAAGHTVRGAWLHAWRVCWAPRRADTVPQTSQSDSLVQAHRHSRLQRSEADQARTNRPRKVSLSSSCMLKEIWQTRDRVQQPHTHAQMWARTHAMGSAPRSLAAWARTLGL